VKGSILFSAQIDSTHQVGLPAPKRLVIYMGSVERILVLDLDQGFQEFVVGRHLEAFHHVQLFRCAGCGTCRL